MGGDRESLLICERPGNRSEDADFGLRIIGGLQLLDDVGEEKGLEVEFSPNSNDDVIVGDFSCS